MRNLRNTSAEIKTASPSVAVFGVGAIEQHSDHLPLGTDWLSVNDICQRVAGDLDALLMPALPFSMSQCHGPGPGTVWLRPMTLAAVVRDITLSLRAQGIHKVVVINGHGGNFVLEAVIREVNLTYPDMMVILYPFEGGLNMARLYKHGDVDSHSGEVETSVMLALRPDLVKEERVDCVPSIGRGFLDYVFMDKISPHGVTGIPSAGDGETGRRALELEARAIVEEVRATFTALESLKSGR